MTTPIKVNPSNDEATFFINQGQKMSSVKNNPLKDKLSCNFLKVQMTCKFLADFVMSFVVVAKFIICNIFRTHKDGPLSSLFYVTVL